jgi:hypothetical protein
MIPPAVSPITPEEKRRLRDAHFARWEMVETAMTRELAAMTEQQRLQIISEIGQIQVSPAPLYPGELPTSGLVEQQALFAKARGT